MLQIAPHRYQSTRGCLQKMGEYMEPLGERALLIANKSVLERYEDVIRSSLKDSMIGVSLDVCLGPCCIPEVERLADEAEKENTDIVVGVGSGKAMDVAKYVGDLTDRATVTVATVASTCAAYTNVVHLYNEEGKYVQEQQLEVCPDLTMLDYKIAGLAPSRFLRAGMGAAFATSYGINLSHEDLELSHPRQIAFDLALHVQDVLLNKGERALADVKRGEVTPTVESVLEVNVLEGGLISSLGGRSFRSMLAHHLARQLMTYRGEEILFGELVAFAVVAQEQVRRTNPSTMRDLFDFYLQVELPLTLDALGLPENQRETILTDASENVKEQLGEHQLPFEFEAEELRDAILEADRLGQALTQSGLGGLD